jgi:hypothetical protein
MKTVGPAIGYGDIMQILVTKLNCFLKEKQKFPLVSN